MSGSSHPGRTTSALLLPTAAGPVLHCFKDGLDTEHVTGCTTAPVTAVQARRHFPARIMALVHA
jgi:hypothetical protein